MGKLAFFLCAVLFGTWFVSVAFKGMGPGVDDVFDALLGDSARVTDLDGFVRKGDGYDVQIRFKASDDFVRALPHQGFGPIDCSAAREVINFSPMRLAAWPLWRPEALTDAVCFRRTGENEWSPRGRDLLLAEPGGGWVYFAGEGEEHDRAMPEADRVIYDQDAR